MCGRFTLASSAERLHRSFGLAAVPDSIEPRYNIAPGQSVLVIPNCAERLLLPARWGLVPHWADDPAIGHRMINARAETVATRPAFRDALVRRRCLIPADGFYEWKGEVKGRRAPFYIRRRDREPFAFAGLWELWRPAQGEPVASCTIVTTAANAAVAPTHDRMPVILPLEDYAEWLAPEPMAAAGARRLLGPCPPRWLEVYPVSTLVNSPARDEPACIEPLRS